MYNRYEGMADRSKYTSCSLSVHNENKSLTVSTSVNSFVFFKNIFSHTVQVLGKSCMSLLTPAHSRVTEEWVLGLEQFLTKR